MTMKSRILLASALEMMGPELAATIRTEGPPAPSPKRAQRREPQRYRGMTEEQRAWNAAVDARKAAKKGAA